MEIILAAAAGLVLCLQIALMFVVVHMLRKDHRADVDAALKLAHDVANDAFVHLRAQTPLQAVQATAVRQETQAVLKREDEVQNFLIDREKRRIEQEDAIRSSQPKKELELVAISDDGKEETRKISLSDYDVVG